MKITISKNTSDESIELTIQSNADDFYNWQDMISKKYKLADKSSKEIFINDIFQAVVDKYKIDFYTVARLEIKEGSDLNFEIKSLLKILPEIDVKDWLSKVDKKLAAKMKQVNAKEKIDIANQIIQNIVDNSKIRQIPNELLLQETVEFTQNLEQEILASNLAKTQIKNTENYKKHLQKYILDRVKTALVVKSLAKELGLKSSQAASKSQSKNPLHQQWLNKERLLSDTQKAIIKIIDK